MSEENQPKDLTNLLGNQSAQITFDNMQKLCNQSEYDIGTGKTFKRKILKPKELVALYKLQNAMDKLSDPEKRMDNIKDQAKICLEDFTDTDFDNCDAVKLEIVIGACLLISKGFRQI